MSQGFVADFGYAHTEVSTWVEGSPKSSFWQGVKTPMEQRVPIGTFRCISCGFLESYARPEFERQ
jgi:hypothetical protein